MNTYLLLLRGVNVGGKNKVPMKELKKVLEDHGLSNVVTYIASGNVIVDTDMTVVEVKKYVEQLLVHSFRLDSTAIKICVLTQAQLQAVIDQKPPGFGEQPDVYYSDAIFLIDLTADQVLPFFAPREGVDKIWPGNGVIYSQRVSALRTKSRLSKIVTSPAYASLTIRSWNTTTKLLVILKARNNS